MQITISLGNKELVKKLELPESKTSKNHHPCRNLDYQQDNYKSYLTGMYKK